MSRLNLNLWIVIFQNKLFFVKKDIKGERKSNGALLLYVSLHI